MNRSDCFVSERSLDHDQSMEHMALNLISANHDSAFDRCVKHNKQKANALFFTSSVSLKFNLK